MAKCEHDMEYGQEAGDFEKDMCQMRCVKCGYQSYMLGKPKLPQSGSKGDRV